MEIQRNNVIVHRDSSKEFAVVVCNDCIQNELHGDCDIYRQAARQTCEHCGAMYYGAPNV